MRGEEQQGGRIQPFCGSGTSAVTAGVSEGKSPDCLQQAETEAAPPAEKAKTAPAVKSKSARSRRIPSFLRRVDLLFQGRR
jgi:hypothetical protein